MQHTDGAFLQPQHKANFDFLGGNDE